MKFQLFGKTIFHQEVNEEFLESNSDPSDVEDNTELFFLKASTNNDMLAGNTFNELDWRNVAVNYFTLNFHLMFMSNIFDIYKEKTTNYILGFAKSEEIFMINPKVKLSDSQGYFLIEMQILLEEYAENNLDEIPVGKLIGGFILKLINETSAKFFVLKLLSNYASFFPEVNYNLLSIGLGIKKTYQIEMPQSLIEKLSIDYRNIYKDCMRLQREEKLYKQFMDFINRSVLARLEDGYGVEPEFEI